MSKTVFLSAGHGGSDPGAVAYGLKEKDINLQTLLACKEVLENHGVIVICSRVKDENDKVSQEVKEANASGADIAVSFHVNASKGDGFEAFYNTSNANGKKLAQLGEKYIKELGQNSRGLKSGNKLYFIKNTTMTAILFESFFIDNDTDNNIGDTVVEQKAFGVAYAKAILEYLGIAYKGGEEVTPEVIEPSDSNDVPFKVKIVVDALNYRAGAGTNYAVRGIVKRGEVYTIVETSGSWGKLKSGAGWINISKKYATRL